MGLEYDVRGMRIELWTQNGKIELQAANYRVIMGSVWDFQHLYRYHMHKHKHMLTFNVFTNANGSGWDCAVR